MTNNDLKLFYEDFHSCSPTVNKNEILKEHTRLSILRNLLKTLNKGKIVVAGCGSRGDLTISAERLIAFDLSYSAVKLSSEAHKKNSFFVGDVSCVPLKYNVIDCIVCSEVIEHVVEPEKAIREFRRVLKANGTLILTVPNWISWYGLARKIVEFITRKSITASHQPVDNWYTLESLVRLVSPYFEIIKLRGIWYYPPIGRRDALLPVGITFFFMRLFQPINLLFSKLLPRFGHCLGIVCKKLT